MTDILLNKILNEAIAVDLFIKWLMKADPQAQYFEELIDCGCSRTDFLTYFLNFVHEEVPCVNKYGDTPSKSNSSKRIEPVNFEESKSNTANVSKYALDKILNKSEASIDSIKITPRISRNTSMPKISKVQEECNMTNGYHSPISPLYREQHSFTTPKNKQQIFTPKSAERTSSLCLGDFIVNKKSSGKKKTSRSLLVNENVDESSKRIKPTSLSQVKVNNGFRQTENSFNKFQDTKEVSVDNVDDSRNFLAEECFKILSRRDSKDSIMVTKKVVTSVIGFKAEMEPDFNYVTDKRQLDYLIDIYVAILQHNLVLNITSEIHFLILLIHSKQFRENSSDDFQMGVDILNHEDCGRLQGLMDSKQKVSGLKLFNSVHNVVYFAVRCLESQVEVLKYYDKSTLKLLSQNKRLQTLSASLADILARISENKPDRMLELADNNDLQTNVCFNLDTDNRENFPSDFSFHAFRKQRDLFYEILQIWEKNHLLTGWSFGISLGGKIKSLFNLQKEPANFMHFARLFKAQLMSTCGKTQKEEGMLESQLPFLTSLPDVDADKLNRLKSRLVTKQASNGINSLPIFTGYQDFHREFIVVASNYTFNKHLCDMLVADIVELNDTKFSCTDLDETDSTIDPSTRKAYVACVKSLRVLAKFLGFVEALPYKSDAGYSDSLLTSHKSIRQQSAPAFDIKHLLLEALDKGNVVVTVPWVATYLSMLDYVALRLPYYIAVHKILFELYRNYEAATLGRKHHYNYNATLLKLTLGWLFELPHFPDAEYFNFCTTSDVSRKITNCVKQRKKLDDLDIVDQNVLYSFCPYLEEIKKLLTSNVTSNNMTVKHITPVTAEQSSNKVATKRLEQQLEEAFYNGQPISVKKTVEFVSERVASSCVKHICNAIVPGFRKTALAELKTFLANWTQEQGVSSPLKERSHKVLLRANATKLVHANLKALRRICETEVSDIAKANIPSCIDNLLAMDTLAQTKAVCVSLTIRLCVDRVKQWIDSHVTLSVLTKDFDAELKGFLNPEMRKIVKEKPLFALPPGGSAGKHNDKATSASHLLEKLKGFSVDILENVDQIDEETVLNVLGDAYVTLTERCDVNDCITMNTCTLLVDISLLLITHKSSIMANTDILNQLVMLWKCYYGKMEDLFKNLLCPRNVMLFAQSVQEHNVWDCFATFVALLIKENLLSAENFESQCVAFFKKDWDQISLSNFTSFLRKFIECYISNGGSIDEFTLLLEFLSNFCIDL